ncbi:MAG: hypothetical protein O3C40_37520 [Planctomycetota bacterium]|nr:hypothetical protein [Planctomycetota bacterium]
MARRSTEAKRSQWAERLRRQGKSGLSIAAFCRRHSVSETGFYYWKRRLKGASSKATGRPPNPEPPRFVQLQETTVSPVSYVEISVASGALIRVPADNVVAIAAAVRVVATPLARSQEGVADA